jgi:hypothetical protein
MSDNIVEKTKPGGDKKRKFYKKLKNGWTFRKYDGFGNVGSYDHNVGNYDHSVGNYDHNVGSYDHNVGNYDHNVGSYNNDNNMSNYYVNTSANEGHESVAKRPKINYADDYDVDDFPVDVDPYSVAPVQELLQVQITLVDFVITVNLISKSGFSILLSWHELFFFKFTSSLHYNRVNIRLETN